METLSRILKAFRKWLFLPSSYPTSSIIHPSFIPDDPSEWVCISTDWRITARYILTTPFSSFLLQNWTNKTYTHLRLKADSTKRLFIDFRSTWPADTYFDEGVLRKNDVEAAERKGIYLASFERYADGTARLILKETPSIIGRISFDLEGITREEYLALQDAVAHTYNF